MDELHSQLDRAVRNLLVDCGACTEGDTVLIVHETEQDGYFEPGIADAVAQVAMRQGMNVETHGVPFQPSVTDPDETLTALMQSVDCTIFFARLGDQIRFRSQNANATQIISYALDREMLGSPFGTIAYDAFDRLKHLINDAFSTASEVRVTCPEGTDFQGKLGNALGAGDDVTRKRFPVSVFTPIPAGTFRGRIVQRGFLTGTGSNYYQPYTCPLEDRLMIAFDGNRITGFEGSDRDVKAAQAHYEFVGATFGIDALFVHSWHVGIHPGCHYRLSAARGFERWSGGAFGNPRLLHFHTCGDYPPGEISLNVLDPTVTLDGVALWKDGRLRPELIPGGEALFERYPEMRSIFANPSLAAGQGGDGHLSFV